MSGRRAAELHLKLKPDDTVADFSSTSTTFKFVVYFFRISGVELDYSKLNSENQRFRYCVLTFGLFVLFFDSVVCIWSAISVFSKYFEHVLNPVLSNEEAFAYVISMLIEFASSTALIIGVHGLLLAISSRDCWRQLWSKLHFAMKNSNPNEMTKDWKRTAKAASSFLVVVNKKFYFLILFWCKSLLLLTRKWLSLVIQLSNGCCIKIGGLLEE